MAQAAYSADVVASQDGVITGIDAFARRAASLETADKARRLATRANMAIDFVSRNVVSRIVLGATKTASFNQVVPRRLTRSLIRKIQKE